MAITLSSLVLNDQIAGTTSGTTDTLYTSTGVITQIDQATAYNAHSSPVLLSVYIVPSGGSAASLDPVCVATINNAESAILTELIGHKMPSGSTLEAFAGTTAVVRVTVSGIKAT